MKLLPLVALESKAKTNRKPIPLKVKWLKELPYQLVLDWNDDFSNFNISGSQQASDSQEFLESARDRNELYLRFKRMAGSIQEMKHFLRQDFQNDILMAGVLQPTLPVAFLPKTVSPSLGLIVCRHTWTHNIYIEFVCIRPCFFRKDSPVTGIGTACLHTAFNLATQLKAHHVTLEPTNSSFPFYIHKLGLDAVPMDHICVSTKKGFAALRKGVK